MNDYEYKFSKPQIVHVFYQLLRLLLFLKNKNLLHTPFQTSDFALASVPVEKNALSEEDENNYESTALKNEQSNSAIIDASDDEG